MHEFSLVRSLLEQVDQIVVEQGGGAVVEVRVESGPLSGVEPLLVQEAFSQLIGRTRAARATLVIDEVPLTACCQACNVEFEPQGFRFVCPSCGGGETKVTRGDQFRLMSVTIDIPENRNDSGNDSQNSLEPLQTARTP